MTFCLVRFGCNEDAAQSITSTYNGRNAGSIVTAGCFSFLASKNLGAAGDGGMTVTNAEQLYERLTAMQNHGANRKYYHRHIGGNFRLDAVQAAALLVKRTWQTGLYLCPSDSAFEALVKR